MDPRIAVLENNIRNSIAIPNRLANNMCFTTTGLGGVFLHYASNSTNNLTAMNSKVRFTMHFPTTGNFGNYVGNVCGLEFSHVVGIGMPRNIKKYTDYTKVVAKVNKWLTENEAFLYEAIENK